MRRSAFAARATGKAADPFADMTGDLINEKRTYDFDYKLKQEIVGHGPIILALFLQLQKKGKLAHRPTMPSGA